MALAQLKRKKDIYAEYNEIADSVHEALLAWKDAMNYFENVLDPDLVEYAIYGMKAAQRRYEYMLKQARAISDHFVFEKEAYPQEIEEEYLYELE